MYCDNCHNSLMGNEIYCPKCGRRVNNELMNSEMKSTESARSTSIVLGIISIFCIFFGIFIPVALVLSIIGLVLAIKSNSNVKNTPGIVINAITLFISAIFTLIIALIIIFSFNTIKEYWHDNVPIVENEIEHGDF